MNKEEIKEILEEPKILMLSYGNYISIDDYVKLKDYIIKLQQENKQLKEDKKKAHKYLKEHTMIGKCVEYYELLEMLGGKE